VDEARGNSRAREHESGVVAQEIEIADRGVTKVDMRF
jgi:hypothetical protein